MKKNRLKTRWKKLFPSSSNIYFHGTNKWVIGESVFVIRIRDGWYAGISGVVDEATRIGPFPNKEEAMQCAQQPEFRTIIKIRRAGVL